MQREECAVVAPAARLMLIAMLVALAGSGSDDELGNRAKHAGSEPLLKRLAKLSLSELQRLAETGALRIIVSCGAEEVAWSLQASARKQAEQALLDYFVRHGAPRTLLRVLFSASRARVDAARRRLRIAPAPGRPKLPRPRERDAIVTAWAGLEPAADRRTRYHTLHRMFPRHSIAALDQVLREALAGHDPTDRRPGNRLAAEPVSAPAARRREVLEHSPGAVVHRRVPR